MAEEIANTASEELTAVAGAIRAWLPVLDARAAAGEANACDTVWIQVRSAALMALGALEDELGMARTVTSRRVRRRKHRNDGKRNATKRNECSRSC